MRYTFTALLVFFIFIAGNIEAKENTPLQKYLSLAEQGDAGAQESLGTMYYLGRGVPQDYKEALKWYTKAAEQGYAEAQAHLGHMYSSELLVPKDYTKPFELITIDELLSKATNRFVIKDYSIAFKWYTKAAEQGHAGAQFQLGRMYEIGQGISQDYSKAFEWYNKAAKQGYAEAQADLGSKYYHGDIILQNYTKAANLFTNAAEQGHAGAQFQLGRVYETGQGVPQDYKKAYAWLNIASAQDISAAQNLRNVISKKLNQSDLIEAQELSNKYYKLYVEPFQ